MTTNDNWKDFCQSIGDALLDDDPELFQCAVDAVETYIIDNCQNFPQNLFAELIDLLKHNHFLKFRDGYYLLNIFADDLGLLKASQKNALTQALREIYPQLEDSATCMVASEIVIDLLSIEEAWEIMKHWIAVSQPDSKALLPYALNYFYDTCDHDTLRKLVLTSLQTLTTDPAGGVQLEAEFSLKLLTHKYS